MTMAVRDPTIAEQERDLVRGLGTQRDEIPEHVRVLSGVRESEYGVWVYDGMGMRWVCDIM